MKKSKMEFLKIVAFGLFAAVTYGVIHDQVTARVCLEYFTIGHPPLIHSASPTLLAFAWGFVATWWVGLPLGAVVAMAAQSGARPKLTAAQVRPYILWLLVAVAVLASMSGLAVYFLATHQVIALDKDWSALLPEGTQIPFLVDLWTHTASYAFGIVGAAVVAVFVFRKRLTLAPPA